MYPFVSFNKKYFAKNGCFLLFWCATPILSSLLPCSHSYRIFYIFIWKKLNLFAWLEPWENNPLNVLYFWLVLLRAVIPLVHTVLRIFNLLIEILRKSVGFELDNAYFITDVRLGEVDTYFDIVWRLAAWYISVSFLNTKHGPKVYALSYYKYVDKDSVQNGPNSLIPFNIKLLDPLASLFVPNAGKQVQKNK